MRTVACDAERLPFADASFDLVLGHAVLHHLPHLDRAFAEFRRVLKPGGRFLFAGEPSRTGDRIAAYPKGAGLRLAPLWRRVVRRAAAEGHDAPRRPRRCGRRRRATSTASRSSRSSTCTPSRPTSSARGRAAPASTTSQVRGEELLANWFGWMNRTLEATARPEDVPWLWRQYAFRGYLLLQRVDVALLEGRLPPAVFYNLMIAGRSGRSDRARRGWDSSRSATASPSARAR